MNNPVSKSQQNALQKQATIVRAALSLFLEQGYGAASMDAVADQAGVTKQTVYRYYASKEELFTAVMEKIRADEPPPYAFGDADLEVELNNFGCDLLAFHLTPPALGVYKMMFCGNGQDSPLQTFMKAGPNRVMKPLKEFLQQRHPQIQHLDFYAQMFATMILAPRNRLIMQGKGRISRSEQQKHVNKVVKLFLQGLQPSIRKTV